MSPNFSSPATLKSFLVAQGVDLSVWGQDDAKAVENLWDELEQGETELQSDPLLRVVTVVQVIIRRNGQILIEAEQELDDERRRSRHHPPSEKIKADEDPVAAAGRCLQEELGLKPHQFDIEAASHRQRIKEEISPSYPGLRTRYIFHVLEATAEDLPRESFWTNEAAHNAQDPVRRHRWVWVDQSDTSFEA